MLHPDYRTKGHFPKEDDATAKPSRAETGTLTQSRHSAKAQRKAIF
jgi:hypothetical protein